MPAIRAEETASIDAPAAQLYAILADYREGHPSILPPRYLDALTVEAGGVGAGTRIRFRVRLAGMTRMSRADVTEPEPGRVLLERDIDTGAETSFTVDPIDERRSLVTIRTTWQAPGIGGWLAKWLAPRMLRRIYAEELSNLARRVR